MKALALVMVAAVAIAADAPKDPDVVLISSALLQRLLTTNTSLYEEAQKAIEEAERLQREIRLLKAKLGCA